MGFGVYQIKGDELTEQCVLEALKVGYRHIDTAHFYENERGVGRAIKKKWYSKRSNLGYIKSMGNRIWLRQNNSSSGKYA